MVADGFPGTVGAGGIFVNPALYEPFGLTILEAMASGLVTVAPKFGGPSELIKDGNNGFLIDPKNTNNVKDVVLRVLGDRALSRAVADRAQEFVINNFSWDRQATQFLKLYSDAVGAKNMAERDSNRGTVTLPRAGQFGYTRRGDDIIECAA